MQNSLLHIRNGGAFILFMLLTACGGGGGGGGSNSNPNADDDSDGFINSQDIDDDNDGLIEIASLEQLDWMRNDMAGTSLTDNNANASTEGCPNTGCMGYELVADLDFDTNGDGMMDANDTYFDYDGDGQNNGWLPIGNVTAPFRTLFEGNNHHISNLYINRPLSDTETSGELVGLFGLVDGRSQPEFGIRNLTLDGNLMQVTGNTFTGGLLGYLQNGSITHSRSTGNIFGNGDNTGGLVGYAITGATISNSYVTGNVTGGNSYTGGLVGIATTDITITDSYATGNVSGNNFTGGLAGVATSNAISTSYATGNVSGSDYTGGLVGLVWAGGTITDSYATGIVTGGNFTAGLVGSVNFNGTIHPEVANITTSFSTGAVSTSGNNNYVGGLIGISYHMNLSNTFASGDVSNANRFVGGLNGDANTGSMMSTSYSVGAVSGMQDIGAFVGWSDGASYVDNYFANDQGQVNAIGTNNSGGGVNPAGTNGDTLANLLSVTNAGNGGFTNWGADWDFGTSDQLPGLIINGVVYRPDISLGSANGNYSGIGTFTTNIRVVDLNGNTPPIAADCVGDINIVVDSNAADVLTGSGRCVTPANFATYTVVGSFQNNVDFTGMITIEFSRVTHILSFSGSRTGNVLNATFAGRTPQTSRLVIDWDGSFSATRP